MNTKILEKANFILIKDNIEFIKKHLYTYFDKTKTQISIITHDKVSVIVVNIKNNTKGDEISWIVLKNCSRLVISRPCATDGIRLGVRSCGLPHRSFVVIKSLRPAQSMCISCDPCLASHCDALTVRR